MNVNQIERNLLLFLDPVCRLSPEEWQLVKSDSRKESTVPGAEQRIRERNLIFCFPRRELLRFILYSLFIRIFRRGTTTRRILFINDGLLSCFFDERKSSCYREFASRHLSQPAGMLRRGLRLLPPVLWADQRFVVVRRKTDSGGDAGNELLDTLDFMFFSSDQGKIMLTRAETFLAGHGYLLKTSALPHYDAKLARENRIVCSIIKMIGETGQLPDARAGFSVNGRCYYAEKYYYGENLRRKLAGLGRSNASCEAAALIDRLDRWFHRYLTAFSGGKCSISSFYSPMVLLFCEVHGEKPGVVSMAGCAEQIIAGLDRVHDGIVPVISHNDLWPGNFIVNDEQLIAVDWERATEESAPFFDYYWMIISAALAYRHGCNGVEDTSVAFRQFLEQKDDVCRQAHEKLRTFLRGLGIDHLMHHQFIMLFLMEWSVQGYRATAGTTDMDRVAYQELMAFYADHADDLRGI